MSELGKVTAFVVTADKPHHLLVFKHPTAGLQLPAGTVERDEDPVVAARREVWEETGLEVTSRGEVIGEQVSQLGSDRAVLLETVNRDNGIFQRGHQVSVLAHDEARGRAQIREEIFDYGVAPPNLLSFTDGEVSADALAYRIRRTFVLFVEQVRIAEPWIQRADGHDFEVQWTRLRQDVPLVDGLKNQKKWLTANFRRLQSCLRALDRH
jgi:8-oxo-dGTP pyrophosphatase MutT (NUDIX family)